MPASLLKYRFDYFQVNITRIPCFLNGNLKDFKLGLRSLIYICTTTKNYSPSIYLSVINLWQALVPCLLKKDRAIGCRLCAKYKTERKLVRTVCVILNMACHLTYTNIVPIFTKVSKYYIC